MKAKICALMVATAIGGADLACGFGLHPTESSDHPKSVSPSRIKSVARITEGYAVWYDVPRESLARRRAGEAELTAAHNRLPIGSLVRVTNVKNGRSVLVRITDRGITNKRAKIDICKEAAIEIGMLHDGIARVRIEVVDVPTTAKTSGSARVAGRSDTQ
jgi:rare lipoprotein A (peptidoglycan hydrolase)